MAKVLTHIIQNLVALLQLIVLKPIPLLGMAEVFLKKLNSLKLWPPMRPI